MAILRLKYQAANSMVPPRLNQVDISQFEHTGFVEIRFTHEGTFYTFKVPFKRPFSKKPVLSSTINLNGGADRNLEFNEFEERFNPENLAEIKIECNYSII